uniref:Fibrinogen C-terminal domain-containing protein n=1 Tax=Poecilia mexicana TaxID=48701 RepID=A0A3B3XE86_9TELE
MKLFCLFLLLAGSTAAFHLDTSPRREPPTLPSEALTTEATPTEAKSRFAMLDDVRLLANGLLQLGQSLREFVHKTKAQINDIFQKLNIFDRSFYQLSVVTSEIKEEEEELKKTTNILKVNNEEIRNLSMEINTKINTILQERTQLQSKVGSLEERLKGLSDSMIPADQLSEITTLKEVIEAQEKTITSLLKAVKEQHDQLDHQKIKIKNLEEKVDQTIDKAIDSDHSATDMFEYLQINSTGTETRDIPADCSELFTRGETKSGVYAVKPNQSEPFYAYCEMSSDHGFTVIQQRVDSTVDFDQTWEMYQKGFGNLEQDFWLGLKKIHTISQLGNYILRIDVEDWKEEKHWAEYSFSLEGPSEDYTLHVSHLAGDLPDAMTNLTGSRFSTKDKNNDSGCSSDCTTRNCTGGWWQSACSETNLNGKYFSLRTKGRSVRRKGIQWRPGTGPSYYLKMSKISLRALTDSGN